MSNSIKTTQTPRSVAMRTEKPLPEFCPGLNVHETAVPRDGGGTGLSNPDSFISFLTVLISRHFTSLPVPEQQGYNLQERKHQAEEPIQKGFSVREPRRADAPLPPQGR